MKIMTFTGSKGGVGKTTILFNYAAWLAQNNYTVLLIDGDFQANLSSTFKTITNENTLLDVFRGGTPEIRHVADHIDLLPASPNLDQVEGLIQNKMYREYVLMEWMRKNADTIKSYDFIMIDTHPEFGLLTKNMIAVSDSVIVPLEPSEYGFQQLKTQFELRMAEYREDSIDPRTGESDIDAHVYFVGNKIQHNTSESRIFREALSEMDNVIGLINFREVMKKALSLKQAVVDMSDEKLRNYKGYKEHLDTQFSNMTDRILHD
ncbi:ParA family protein [Weissella cibaria]|nr:AAA family ATPase [Weissella cibaria]